MATEGRTKSMARESIGSQVRRGLDSRTPILTSMGTRSTKTRFRMARLPFLLIAYVPMYNLCFMLTTVKRVTLLA